MSANCARFTCVTCGDGDAHIGTMDSVCVYNTKLNPVVVCAQCSGGWTYELRFDSHARCNYVLYRFIGFAARVGFSDSCCATEPLRFPENDDGAFTARQHNVVLMRRQHMTDARHCANSLLDVHVEQHRVHFTIEPCADAECMDCAQVACPHADRLHFHHDGCPSCIA